MIPLINTSSTSQSTLDWHLNWCLINTRSTVHRHLEWHLNWYSVDTWCNDKKLISSRLTVDWDVGWVSLMMTIRGIKQHFTVDAFSICDLSSYPSQVSVQTEVAEDTRMQCSWMTQTGGSLPFTAVHHKNHFPILTLIQVFDVWSMWHFSIILIFGKMMMLRNAI